MLAGELYDPLDPLLCRERLKARDLCQELNASGESETARRATLLRELLGYETDVWLQPPFFCDYGTNLHLGRKVFFNFNCVVLDVMPARIGDYTLFGPAVQIYTATHPSTLSNGGRGWNSPGRWSSVPTSGWVVGRSPAPACASAPARSSVAAAWSRATSGTTSSQWEIRVVCSVRSRPKCDPPFVRPPRISVALPSSPSSAALRRRSRLGRCRRGACRGLRRRRLR